LKEKATACWRCLSNYGRSQSSKSFLVLFQKITDAVAPAFEKRSIKLFLPTRRPLTLWLCGRARRHGWCPDAAIEAGAHGVRVGGSEIAASRHRQRVILCRGGGWRLVSIYFFPLREIA
jgi:hypothetical protein